MKKPAAPTQHPKKIPSPFRLKDFPGFSPCDLKFLEEYYSSQMSAFRSPEKRVGWKTPQSQRVRFENLIKVGPLQKSKILDVGCGLGAFRGFLKEQKIPVDYTGVDIFPGMIEEAKGAYPDAKFETRLLADRPFPAGRFDYAFLSGVFNIRVEDNWKYMRFLLKNVLKQTKKAVAFNVLNKDSGLKETNRFTVTPREIVSLGRKLGVTRTHLLDNYHHLDLTLFLYK